MNRYRVGVIEGRWVNFIPPIEGGKFRTTAEQDDISNDSATASTAASSTTGSRSASPVFDIDGPALRRRKATADECIPSSASASSVSSADAVDDGMAHLDSVTREQINLDLEKYPPLDPVTQDAIVHKYRLLNERIKAEGLYKCNYWAYAIECSRYLTFFSLFLVFLHWGWYMSSAVFLGIVWHQLTFTAHDAGHMGITHDFHTDSVIGALIADFCGGLSIGWWKRNHNVHHIVTNSPEHDPDIQHMPFLAISHRLLASLKSTYYEHVMKYDIVARHMVRVQHYTYYVLMLFGRVNLYRLSWDYLLGGKAPRKGPAWWHWYLEMTGMIFFWTWYGYFVVYKSIPTNGERALFVLISHMVPMPLHVQITLSHFAMSTAQLGPHESFPQKMLRTTMDVDCPQWLDFFHGGLQFQAIHHLYPRIPRHNLRRTQKLVQEFCDEVDIPYALYGFVDGNRQVIGILADVARQAAILAKCQSVMAASDDPLGHSH